MTVLSGALAIHELVAASRRGVLAGGVPNPAPKAPPGLTGPVNTLLAWWKWGALVAGSHGPLPVRDHALGSSVRSGRARRACGGTGLGQAGAPSLKR